MWEWLTTVQYLQPVILLGSLEFKVGLMSSILQQLFLKKKFYWYQHFSLAQGVVATDISTFCSTSCIQNVHCHVEGLTLMRSLSIFFGLILLALINGRTIYLHQPLNLHHRRLVRCVWFMWDRFMCYVAHSCLLSMEIVNKHQVTE